MVVHKNCQLWVHIIGVDKNSGQPMDQFCCEDKIRHSLLIENTAQQRETTASVQAMRNDIIRSNDMNLEVMLRAQMQMREAMLAIGYHPPGEIFDTTPLLPNKEGQVQQ